MQHQGVLPMLSRENAWILYLWRQRPRDLSTRPQFSASRDPSSLLKMTDPGRRARTLTIPGSGGPPHPQVRTTLTQSRQGHQIVARYVSEVRLRAEELVPGKQKTEPSFLPKARAQRQRSA